MKPQGDPLSSTDGAGREWTLEGRVGGRASVAWLTQPGEQLAPGERVKVVEKRVACERTRVLEEIVRHVAGLIVQSKDGYSKVPVALIEQAQASLAAVAVEDGGPATDDSLAGTRARIGALADGGFRLDGSLWVRFSDVVAALESSGRPDA